MLCMFVFFLALGKYLLDEYGDNIIFDCKNANTMPLRCIIY